MFYRIPTLEQGERVDRKDSAERLNNPERAGSSKLVKCFKQASEKLIFCLVAIQLVSCASSVPTETMDPSNWDDPTQAALLDEYKIGVGDSLQISVWRNPDLSAEVVVLPDGKISVPLAGDIKAAGETTESLSEQISAVLDNYIRQPEVTVSVLNATSSEYLQRVRITGAVDSPLSLNYRRGMTVLDIVLQAGGISLFANPNKALLYRQEGAELKVYPVRLEDILTKGKLETNYKLLPSDIITVPEKRF